MTTSEFITTFLTAIGTLVAILSLLITSIVEWDRIKSKLLLAGNSSQSYLRKAPKMSEDRPPRLDLQELKELFKFSDDTIYSNRNGHLTESTWLMSFIGVIGMFAVVLAGIFIFLLLIFSEEGTAQLQESLQIFRVKDSSGFTYTELAILSLVFITAGTSGIMAVSGTRIRSDVGPLEKLEPGFLRVGKTKVTVSRKVWKKMEARYTGYYKLYYLDTPILWFSQREFSSIEPFVPEISSDW